MAELPIGELTFLLTEVVGSTVLWERHPAAMPRATTELDLIVGSQVGAHGGHVVKPRGEGDGHFSVFIGAADALGAAVALMAAVAAHPWPGGLALVLRAAVHTGAAERRDGDYYGTAVNRCARMRGIAGPGQVLVSAATAGTVATGLPEGISLRDVGRHYLRDLARPEQISQLCHPSLPAEFAPLVSASHPVHGLPIPLTSLVGRDAMVEELVAAIGTGGTVWVTGAPGVGKSRVAMEALAQFVQDHPERRGEVALIDDADHEARPAASGWSLVTSRMAPVDAAVVIAVAPLDRRQSVQLLLDRAGTVRPSTDAIVEEICARLNGLPLAIELCAGRLAVVSPERLLARLDDPARLLVSPTRRVPEHHRSLVDAVRWTPELAASYPDGSLLARVAAGAIDELRRLR